MTPALTPKETTPPLHALLVCVGVQHLQVSCETQVLTCSLEELNFTPHSVFLTQAEHAACVYALGEAETLGATAWLELLWVMQERGGGGRRRKEEREGGRWGYSVMPGMLAHP